MHVWIIEKKSKVIRQWKFELMQTWTKFYLTKKSALQQARIYRKDYPLWEFRVSKYERIENE